MTGQTVSRALLALSLLALPAAPARACCFLKGLCGGGCCGAAPTSTFYAPPAPACCAQPYTASYAPSCCAQPYTASYAPSCCPQQCTANYAPACAPQACTVNYMPQTCYRTVYYNAPVVAYSPVTACDPCTGCPTTVMRPYTSYVTAARVVPYTTYRPVVAAMPVAPACSTCPTGGAPATSTFYAPTYAPSAPVAPAAPSGCCTSRYAPAGVPMPVAAVTPGPAYRSYPQTTGYATTVQATTPLAANAMANPATPIATTPVATPLAPVTQQVAQPKMIENPQPVSVEAEPRILLPPRSDSPSGGAPRALDSEDQDRTTALPVRQAWAVKRISATIPLSPSPKKSDAGGWRAARD